MKSKVENIPYKSLTIDKLTNPLSGKVESLDFILCYQEITLGKWQTIGDDVIIVVQEAKSGAVIPSDKWGKEITNFTETLKQLYPNPYLAQQKETRGFSNDTKKWILAGLVLLVILYILARKLFL